MEVAYIEDHPLCGDVLDVVVSHCTTLDLHPASHVSKAWRTAVFSSLRRSPRSAPWLFLHQLHDPARGVSTRAFDPLTRRWQSTTRSPATTPDYKSKPCLRPPVIMSGTPYNCYSYSGGTRLYALCNSKLVLSDDAVGTSWREMDAPPQSCRTSDPVVAVVGPHVVVAGGAVASQMFGDDDETCVAIGLRDGAGCDPVHWEMHEHTPESLTGWRWSASATSVAVSDRRMYVLEKQQPGRLSWFEPATNKWGPTRHLRLPAVFLAALGFIDGRLVVAGVVGRSLGSRPEGLRLWAVDEETLEVEAEEELGRMPAEMVEGLVEEGSDWGLWSIGFLCSGQFGYIYNPSYPKVLLICDLAREKTTSGDRWRCRWERVRQPALTDGRPRLKSPAVYTCSNSGD